MNKTIYYFFFLLLFLINTRAYSQSSTLEKAKNYFEYADYENALLTFNSLIDEAKKSNDEKYKIKGELGALETLIKTGRLLQAEERINKLNEVKGFQNNIEFANIYSLFLLQKGKGEEAIEELENSLQKLNNNSSDSLKAKIYNDLGIAYWNTGRDQQALDYLAQSLSINSSIFSGAHPSVAANYNNMGLVYANLDLDKALEYYELALAIYEKIYPKNHPSVGNAYINLGSTYNEKQEYLSADYNSKQALEIFQNVYGEEHPSVAFVYNSLGVTSLEDELFNEAKEYHRKALTIYRKLYGNRHQEIANTFNLLGTVYARDGEYKEALNTYQQALIANTLEFSSNDIYLNPPENDFINVLTILNTIVSKAKTFEALHYNKTLKFKHLEAALNTYAVGDKLIDAVRVVRDSEADKLALGATASEIYQRAIELCISLSDVSLRPNYFKEKAFYFSEKNKSAILLSAISDTKAKEFANIPENLLEEEDDIKNDIAFYQQQLAKAKDDDEKEQFRAFLFEKNQQYQEFIEKLGVDFPEYFSLKYAVKVSTVEKLQENLPLGTALISYTHASETGRMFVFLITAKKFNVFDLVVDDDIETQITLLRNTIIWQVDDVFLEAAHQLYKQLIPKKIPATIKDLIIIPDGILGTTPFESFVGTKMYFENETNWNEVDFLSKKYGVSYAYSATLYNQKQLEQSDVSNQSIFLCAPVDFEENQSNQKRKGLNSLPATLSEVESIKNTFVENGLSADIVLQDDAHEEIVKSSELKKYKYLHFATHGVVDEDYPELSQVFLAPHESEEHDGDLYSGEIYNLEIEADLVTLSACQTGLGKVTKGEGIMGLSRALLFAGAKNLVVSLWSVSDASTSELMIDFYEEIAKNPNVVYTEALQSAKQRMIREGEYAAPYYWAPFILIGR